MKNKGIQTYTTTQLCSSIADTDYNMKIKTFLFEEIGTLCD